MSNFILMKFQNMDEKQMTEMDKFDLAAAKKAKKLARLKKKKEKCQFDVELFKRDPAIEKMQLRQLEETDIKIKD